MLLRVAHEPGPVWQGGGLAQDPGARPQDLGLAPEPGRLAQGQDCLLVCSGGTVAAHSALLASASPLLAALLSAPGVCAGCPAPRALVMPGVEVAEARALVQLLYSGSAPLPTPPRPATPTAPLVRLLGLADTLGLNLTGLTATTSQGRVIHIQEQARPATPPVPDPRAYTRARAPSQDVKPRAVRSQDIKPQDSRPQDSRPRDRSSQDNKPQSQDSRMEDSQCEAPRPQDPGGQDITRALEARRLLRSPPPKPSLLRGFRSKSSWSSRARSPTSPPPGPQARVLMSDTALIDLMDIKQEVVEDEVVAELEGREEGEDDDDDEEEEYPDMDNYGRNYVCIKCSKGFTFAKSYNWHSSRCEGGEGRGRPTENSAVGRGKVEKMPVKVPSKRVVASRERSLTPRCRSVTPQPRPRAAAALDRRTLAGPGTRKKIQLTKSTKDDAASTKKEAKEKVKDKRMSEKVKRQVRTLDLVNKKVEVKKPVGRPKGTLAKKKLELAKKTVLKKRVKEAESSGRPARARCGRCAKCRMAPCGACAGCAVGGVRGLRGCVRKVCRNKARRSVWS